MSDQVVKVQPRVQQVVVREGGTTWSSLAGKPDALGSIGAAGGLATLDDGGKVPGSQIPDLRSTYVNKLPTAGAAVRGIFTASTPEFVVWREDTTAEAYWLGRKIANGLWDCYQIFNRTAADGTTVSQLWFNQIRRPVARTDVDQEDPSVTFVGGANWVKDSNTGAESFGGSFRRDNVAGDYAEWASGADADSVGIHAYGTSNAGYAKITIDGGDIVANRLPTAQDEVDSGKLDSAALVANGGTLLPEDRLVDFFFAPPDPVRKIVLADGLTPGEPKTVRVTVTGYKRSTSTDSRVYLAGFFYSALGTDMVSEARENVASLVSSGSAWEYAFQTGFSDPVTFIGNIHGHDQEVSRALLVDGSPVTLADGEGVAGSQILMLRKSQLKNPSNASESLADVSVTYLLAPDGLRVGWTVKWLKSGKLVAPSYTTMCPRDPSFDRCRNVSKSLPESLNDDAGGFKANAASDSMLIWQGEGNYATFVNIPDPSVSHRAFPGGIKLAVEDRAGGGFNKVYAARADIASPESFVAGDFWRGSQIYSTARFDDPEAVLGVV